MTTRHGNATLDERPAFTVSELNREARNLLEGHFTSLVVEGELSNIARPASGHWYFTLKDERAQLRCAMFRNRNMLVRFRPEDGGSVRLQGRLSIYEGRGDYQLIVERMEPAGDGALQRAFEELKKKLQQEGLFEQAHKRALPAHIRHLGVITSASGAAIRDILSTLARRFPAMRVTVLPVSVQGQEAAAEIIAAIKLVNQRRGCLSDLDALIVGRGGGSLEDLWSFNDETLARTIHASELPIVSAVGHEVDFTIADFVADLRAPTPTAAAELISPDQNELKTRLNQRERRLQAAMTKRLNNSRQQLTGISKRLRHPGRRLQDHAQTLDRLETRLRRAIEQRLQYARQRLRQQRQLLNSHAPHKLLPEKRQALKSLRHRLDTAWSRGLDERRQRLARSGHALHTVSPLATLSRGYAIVQDDDGHVIRSSNQLAPAIEVSTRLGAGRFRSTITHIEPPEETE